MFTILLLLLLLLLLKFIDNTHNGGSTTIKWKFSKTWTKKTVSTYSEEHGWRLKVSTTFSSGLLSDAIAKWQVTAEAEGHGKYVTTNTDEETVGNVYERMFDVIFAVFFFFLRVMFCL